MTEVVALAALAVVCWAFRVTFVLWVPAERLPPRVQECLIYLAPAVLGGLVAVEVTSLVTAADVRGSVLAVLAVGVLALVAWRFRNLTLTVAVGLVAVLAIDVLI